MHRTLKVCPGLVPILVFATLFIPLIKDSGLAIGFDTYLHVGNVVECAYLLGEKLPPFDWVPDVAGGRGGPNYIFYGSAGFLAPAALVRLGLDPIDSIRIWTAVLVLVGFLSASLWCSRFDRVNSRSHHRARFHQYWFDGWRAEIDGRSVPVAKDGEGLCVLDLPPGVHDVSIRFTRTPLHQPALAVSVVGWCSVLGFSAFRTARRLLARRNGATAQAAIFLPL